MFTRRLSLKASDTVSFFLSKCPCSLGKVGEEAANDCRKVKTYSATRYLVQKMSRYYNYFLKVFTICILLHIHICNHHYFFVFVLLMIHKILHCP